MRVKSRQLFKMITISLVVITFIFLAKITFAQDNDWVVNGDNMYSGVKDNVGIGTKNPSMKLDILGGDIQITDNQPSLFFTDTDSDHDAAPHDFSIYVDKNALIFFHDSKIAERMRIDSSGQVGIGTTKPNRSLTVYKPGPSTGVYGNWKNGDEEILIGVDDSGGIISTMSNHDLQLRAGENKTKMIIKANGNVGIGTTSPERELTIDIKPKVGMPVQSNQGGVTLQQTIQQRKFTIAEIKGTNGTNPQGAIDLYSGIHNKKISINAKGNSWFNTDGNFGIGTNKPKHTLDVTGNINANGAFYLKNHQIIPDYVFKPDYKLESIEEHTSFSKEQKHLKSIPELKKNEAGIEFIDLASHLNGMLEELEKAHLYIEQLYQQNKKLTQQNITLERRLVKLETHIKNMK